MQTIWKYTLTSKNTLLEVPKGAILLSIHEQRGEICLWALVDPFEAKEIRHISVFGTGQTIPAIPMTFIGTAHLLSSALVFHVFEIK